jgi:hypothetical protein
MHNDGTFNYNMEFFKKEKRLMNEIDYLEVIVNTLGSEADNLISQLDQIELKLGIVEDDINSNAYIVENK